MTEKSDATGLDSMVGEGSGGPRKRRPFFTPGRIVLLVVVLLLAYPALWVATFVRTAMHIPEAYAAWDTGSLLVRHLEVHERWPSSWEELLAVAGERDDPNRVFLRGGHDREHLESLADFVAIDWSFDITAPDGPNPVTRINGKDFTVYWEDPNEMVRLHLAQQKEPERTGPSPPPGTVPRSSTRSHRDP